METHDAVKSPTRGRDTLLKIYSVNIRGLVHRNRGEQALTELMLSRHNIFFLQETHVYNNTQEEKLSKKWKGQSYWDLGKVQSCGVAILIKENFPLKIIDVQKSNQGRYIILDGILNEQKIRLTNTYFPNSNKHRIQLINTLSSLTPTISAHIIAGDFNFVEDQILGKSKGRRSSGATTRKCFDAFKQNSNLVDVFRSINPTRREYTHTDKPTNIKTRIDRIYADKATAQSVMYVNHVINSFADHSAVTACFKVETKAGPGYWKCNVSTLSDIDFKADLMAMWDKQMKNNQGNINLEWWELCKSKIEDLIIWHSTRLAKNRADNLNTLDKEINYLKKLHNCEIGNQHPSISEKIGEKISILNYQIEGAKVRTKINRLETDEKPIGSFLNIEKQRGEKTNK